MDWRRRIFYREGRLRPVFRIAIFFLLFFLFGSAGQYVIAMLPRHPLQWGSLAAMTLAALLASLFLITRIDGRPFGALGFPLDRSAPRDSALGFLIGTVLIAVTVLLLVITGSATLTGDTGTLGGYFLFLGWTLLFFFIAAAFEEVVFRGYPFQVLVEWIGVWPAVIIASALFAAMHGQNPGITWIALVNIFIAGVMLSVAYLKTRSLWFVTGIHLGWNWTMSSLFDFPVSGLGFETPLYTGVPTGPQWWTGGTFGPEAGIAGSVMLAVAIVYLIRTAAFRPTPGMTARMPLVDPRVEGSMIA